jgi:hypothetical protein
MEGNDKVRKMGSRQSPESVERPQNQVSHGVAPPDSEPEPSFYQKYLDRAVARFKPTSGWLPEGWDWNSFVWGMVFALLAIFIAQNIISLGGQVWGGYHFGIPKVL